MATKKSTAVAKAEDTAMAAYGEYGGANGFEDTDASELAIPFINVLQSNSAVVEDGNGKAGDLYNNVMETVYEGSEGIRVIPCARQRVFVEWVPIDDGGGLVAVHDPDSEFVVNAIKANGGDTRGIRVADGKHELVETIYLYVLILDDEGGFERAVISFTSTKLKAYRNFYTKANYQMVDVGGGRKVRVPMWGHVYRVTTFRDENKKGQKYSNIKLEFDAEKASQCRLTPADDLFQEGQAFFEMVGDGSAKADLSTADKADGGASGSAEAGEDIPF